MDDTILFSTPNETHLDNLFKSIKLFEEDSGLNINCQKSEFMGIGLDKQNLALLADHFGCKSGGWPNIYLGLPLNRKPKSLAFWEPVIEKIEKRLQTWGSQHLSKGGRLTLIQATLQNMPIYCLSLFKAPKKVTNKIKKFVSELFMARQK